MSYDNHHNIVGLIKKLYQTLCCKIQSKHKIKLVKDRMYSYTGIEDTDFIKNTIKLQYRK